MNALKIRIMPKSPQVDLTKLENELKTCVDKLGENIHSIEKEPIAFGLVALNMIVRWPETKDQSVLENEIKKIKDVESAEVIDFRREFG